MRSDATSGRIIEQHDERMGAYSLLLADHGMRLLLYIDCTNVVYEISQRRLLV